MKALGHIIDKQGISPDPEKVKAAWEFPRPPMEGRNSKKLKALRAFLGYLSYYRRFINGFAVLAKPLHNLVKATRLAYLDNTRPFEIHPDACNYGIGAALVQRGDAGERPIAFVRQTLTKTEINYSITGKECLALVWAVKKFHSYIWGEEV